VSPAKNAEQLEMPFGLRTLVGPRNHVLDGVNIPMGRAITDFKVLRDIAMATNFGTKIAITGFV